MNVKYVKPGMRVRVFQWENLVLPSRAGSQGEFREVRFNEPVTGPGRAKRRLTLVDGSAFSVETMADLIVED